MSVFILIVDDHPVICHGLRRILEKQSDFVIAGEAGDWKSARAGIREHRPNIVILDITLQGVDGVSLIKRIRESECNPRVIMYTTHDSREYITRSFQAGALGYVLKSDKTEELITAIRRVMLDRVYLSSSLQGFLAADPLGGGAGEDTGATSVLTDREYEVAALLAQGRTPDKIAETLYISPQTVRVHRTNIMHKLSCTAVHELLLKLPRYFPQ